MEVLADAWYLYAPPVATVVQYYINTSSTSGGDGTTNATTGAGRAFVNWTDAKAAIYAAYPNFVAANVQVNVDVTGLINHASLVGFDGFVGDATHFLRVRAASGQQHAGYYDASKAGFTTTATSTIYPVQSYTRFENLQIVNASSGTTWGSAFQELGTADVLGLVISGCVLHRTGRSGTAVNNGEAYQYGGIVVRDIVFANNVISGSWFRTIDMQYSSVGSRIVVYNNTIVAPTGTTYESPVGTPFTPYAIDIPNVPAGSFYIKNNRVEAVGNGGCYNLGSNTQITSTNFSSDTTSPDTAGRSKTGTYVNAAGFNYTLTSGDAGVGAGTPTVYDVTYILTTDILGTQRPLFATWDVGAFEFGARGTLAVPVPTLAGAGTVTNPSTGFTGTGTLTVAKPTLAGTGQGQRIGSGTLAVAKPTLAGTGQQRFTATGTLAVAKPTLAGTGQQRFTATGTLAVAKPTLAGTGTNTPRAATSTGTLAVAKPTLAGTGQQRFTASGTLAVAKPALAGTGQQRFTATGTLAVAKPTLTSTGTNTPRAATSTGTLAVAVPTLAGVGTRGLLGSGTLAVAKPTLAGTGQQRFTATGTLAVAVPTLAGVGKRSLLGSGTLAVAKPTLAGTGQQRFTASGTLAVAKPTLTGTGTASTAPGIGSLILARPILAGAGLRGILGSGTLAVAKPTLAGTGQQRFTATGTLAVAKPTLAGAGQGQRSGSGTLAVAKPTLAGSAKTQFSASGSMAVAKPTLAGAGQQRHTGTGTLTKPPTIASAGRRGIIGAGSMAVAKPTLAGTATGTGKASGSLKVTPTLAGVGQIRISGSGTLSVVRPTVGGSGVNAQDGSGTLAVAPRMAGVGTRVQQVRGTAYLVIPLILVSGDGLMVGGLAPATGGKYGPEASGARSDLAAATGFIGEHDSALADLSGAGI